jgi:8-oxo-dGTP diphosphatase
MSHSMTFDRFGAMVGAFVWRKADGKYLILKRSEQRDFAAGEWECVTGKVEHGKTFSTAVRREASEEPGREVHIEYIVGTIHFYRGAVGPEQEMVGVHYCCSIEEGQEIQLSPKHSTCKWVTTQEAEDLFPASQWLPKLIVRADAMRRAMPEELQRFHQINGFEI